LPANRVSRHRDTARRKARNTTCCLGPRPPISPAMTSFSTLSLYALTVKAPSATQEAISGDFVGSGNGHVLTANGSRLTLYEVSKYSNGFKELYSQDVFGIIRRIAKFRLAGSTKGTSSLSATRKAL